jgi:outer membrane protein OmpA-like peptidoglycan-associated protein
MKINSSSCVVSLLMGVLGLVACATVPDSAPPALHEAYAEIERAKDLGTGDLFPKTLDQSEEELSAAVESFQAVDPNSRSGTDWSEHPSVTQARRIGERMKKANAIRIEMDALDGQLDELGSNVSITSLSAQVAQLKANLFDMEKKLASAQAEAEAAQFSGATTARDRFALLSEMTLKGPTVFFETNKAVLASADRPALKELAQSLRSVPQIQLRLVGYADPRGTEELNEKLSLRRAQMVQDFLLKNGVRKDQVTILAMGERASVYNKGIDKLQLERRVEMIFAPKM